MAEVGQDLGERFQDEAPRQHPRMRDDEVPVIHAVFAEEKNVDVQRARCVPLGPHAPRPALDVEAQLEQSSHGEGAARTAAGDDLVQVASLASRAPHGLGLEDRRGGERREAGGAKFAPRHREVAGPIADIRAQRQYDPGIAI